MYSDIDLLVTSGIGTVGHGKSPPITVDWPSQSDLRGGIGAPAASMATENSSATVNHHSYATASDAARIIRAQRLRDLLASIEEFWRASGSERVWWRRDALWRLREWRRLHAIPERAAFQQAVARGLA